MKKLLIALLAISPIANADALYLGGWSSHLSGSKDNTGYEYNSNHELVAVEYSNVFIGAMLNSYHARGYIAGYKFDLYETQYIDLSLIAGGVHGYTEAQNDIARIGSINGFLAPTVEFNTPYIKPTLTLFGTAAALMFKYEF
ncbi:hypothetical protein NVP1236O_52 [Vibrio phage 1.236.O._10N.261.52.C4]|nr:hypothetical protein NVP1236O_52 [Vibrio phage 1.236.O._10N.261.52.C4]